MTIGKQILREELEKDPQKHKIRAMAVTDQITRLQHEMKALEAKIALKKITESQFNPLDELRRYARKLAKKYDVLAELTNDPTEKARHKQTAAKYRRDAKQMTGRMDYREDEKIEHY